MLIDLTMSLLVSTLFQLIDRWQHEVPDNKGGAMVKIQQLGQCLKQRTKMESNSSHYEGPFCQLFEG